MEKHTPGALRAAAVIMNGKKMISTEYGKKTAEGIADLIDRETGAGELLEALRALLETDPSHYDHYERAKRDATRSIAKAKSMNNIEKAIKRGDELLSTMKQLRAAGCDNEDIQNCLEEMRERGRLCNTGHTSQAT